MKEIKNVDKTRLLNNFAKQIIGRIRRIPEEGIEFKNPTLEERIVRMENMYKSNYPTALKKGILENIIQLRTKKILKDHCE